MRRAAISAFSDTRTTAPECQHLSANWHSVALGGGLRMSMDTETLRELHAVLGRYLADFGTPLSLESEADEFERRTA